MLDFSFLRSIEYLDYGFEVSSPALDFVTSRYHFLNSNIFHPSTAFPIMTIFPTIPAADNKGLTKAVAKSNDYNNGPIRYPL